MLPKFQDHTKPWGSKLRSGWLSRGVMSITKAPWLKPKCTKKAKGSECFCANKDKALKSLKESGDPGKCEFSSMELFRVHRSAMPVWCLRTHHTIWRRRNDRGVTASYTNIFRLRAAYKRFPKLRMKSTMTMLVEKKSSVQRILWDNHTFGVI